MKEKIKIILLYTFIYVSSFTVIIVSLGAVIWALMCKI